MCIKLAKHNRDQDVHIWETLGNPGVHTGCLPDNPILDSGVWLLRDPSGTSIPSQEEQEPFLWCEGNWQGAGVDEEVTLMLIKGETEQCWVRVFDGTLQDAKNRWGADSTAVGKINVVRVDGEERPNGHGQYRSGPDRQSQAG